MKRGGGQPIGGSVSRQPCHQANLNAAVLYLAVLKVEAHLACSCCVHKIQGICLKNARPLQGPEFGTVVGGLHTAATHVPDVRSLSEPMTAFVG